MNPPSQDIKDILVTAGIGTFAATSGWAIYVARQPDQPDTTITLYDTGGTPLEGLCDQEIDNFTFQVKVRANGYQAAYAKFQEIEEELNGTKNHEVVVGADTIRYQGIWRLQPAEFLRFDEEDRAELVQNYAGMRQVVS